MESYFGSFLISITNSLGHACEIIEMELWRKVIKFNENSVLIEVAGWSKIKKTIIIIIIIIIFEFR